MIRLKSVHFIDGVAPPGATALTDNSYPPPNARAEDFELQLDGPWIAIWKRGEPLPRLAGVGNVRQATPVEVPKGFVMPDWEGMARARHEAAKKAEDARVAASERVKEVPAT